MKSVGIKLVPGTAFAILGCWVIYLAVEMVGIFGDHPAVRGRVLSFVFAVHFIAGAIEDLFATECWKN